MKPRVYALLGVLVLAALTWAHWVGWAPGAVHEEKLGPRSVRGAAGYRPAYGTGFFRGGK